MEAHTPEGCPWRHLFLHDREERLLEIINEKGEHYAFGMDAAGNVLQEEGFDGGVRKYVRDRAGRVIKETLPCGKFKESSTTGADGSRALPMTTTRRKSISTATMPPDGWRKPEMNTP